LLDGPYNEHLSRTDYHTLKFWKPLVIQIKLMFSALYLYASKTLFHLRSCLNCGRPIGSPPTRSVSVPFRHFADLVIAESPREVAVPYGFILAPSHGTKFAPAPNAQIPQRLYRGVTTRYPLLARDCPAIRSLRTRKFKDTSVDPRSHQKYEPYAIR
jgi:hypothetical protein